MTRPLAMIFFTVLTILALLPSLTLSLRVSGRAHTAEEFHFIGKFAYATSGGNLSSHTINHRDASISGGQLLVLYPDTHGSWDTIVDSGLTCAQKVSLGRKVDVGIDFDIAVTGSRPHFWYLVIADCDTLSAIDVSYDLHFTNGGSVWSNEVSWDRVTIVEMTIAFVIFYVLALPALLHAYVRTRHTKDYYQYLALMVVVACQLIYQVLALAYYASGMDTGVYNDSLDRVSWWFNTFSVLALLALVMLTAAGWPSQSRALSVPVKACVSATMVLYVAFYIASFAVNVVYESSHPSNTVYEFNHWPGYLLCALRVVTVMFVLACVQSTISRDGERKRTYLCFAVYASVWLCSFPLITLGATLTENWWRAKAAYGVTNIVMALAVITHYTVVHPFNSAPLQFKQMQDDSAVAVVVDGEKEREHSVSVGKPDTVDAEGVELTSAGSRPSSRPASPRGQVVPL